MLGPRRVHFLLLCWLLFHACLLRTYWACAGFSGGQGPRPGLQELTLSRDTGEQTYEERLLASVCPWRLVALGIGHGWPPRGRAGEALVLAHPSEWPTEGYSDGQACRLPL